jgi:hypothetical protein
MVASRPAAAWATRWLLLTTTAWAWASCVPFPTSTDVPVRGGVLVPRPKASRSPSAAHTIVLLAIDGVRWQDVFRGVDPELAAEHGLGERELLAARTLLPNLHALMRSGTALGAPGTAPGIAASGPNFMSVPGYMEMLSGRTDTGCTHNGCDPVSFPTLADDFAVQTGVSALDVAVIASWDGLERAAARDTSRITLSVGRSRGATRGNLRFDLQSSALLDAGSEAGPFPGFGDFRRDRETAALGLHYLRAKKPRFLFLGLGETDEYAHRNDYRGYLHALVQSDRIVGEVAAALAELENDGRRTTLFVTTDHGRSAGFSGHGESAPESADVWLVASGFGIGSRGPVAGSGERRLADVATTIRLLAGVGHPHASSSPLTELLAGGPDRVASVH